MARTGTRRAQDAVPGPPSGDSAAASWPTALLLGVAFVALLVLAAGGAAFLVGRWSADDETRRAEQSLALRAARDAVVIADHFEDRLALLAAIAAHPEWRVALSDAATREAVVASIRAVWPDAPAVAWIEERGRVVIAAGTLRLGDEVAGRRWFDAAPRGPLFSEEGDTLRAVVPLQDGQGRTAGVLSVEVACAAIEQRLRPAPAAEGTAWALLGRQGQLLCGQSGFDAALALAAPSSGAAWAEAAPQRTLLAAQRVGGVPAVQSMGWRLAVAQPLDAALPRARERVPRILAAGGLVALLALPLVWLLAQRLARPLRELARALDQAREQFDYDPRHIPVQGTREARALGRAARAMLGQIVTQQAVVNDSARGYRELFELHPLPMWVVDDESLRFVEVNDAAVRKYGWRRDEFLLMRVPDLHPPEAHAALLSALDSTREDEHHAVVWQHRLRSGEVIDAEIASRQLLWGGRPARIAAVMDMTLQRRASIELQRQRRELSALARQLMTAEEAERRRLAQVLHDRHTPTLYGMKLNLEALRTRLGEAPSLEDLRAEVSRVVAPLVQALDGAIADTRNLMSDLRPPLLVEQGLAAALAHEVERQRRDDGPRLRFLHHVAAAPTQRDLAFDYAVFMIAQAALNNALQHAQARQVTLDLDEAPGRLQLAVRDDGRGFDSALPPPAGHLGLVGMQERARWIGAELTIESVPGMGTTASLLWRAAAPPTPTSV